MPRKAKELTPIEVRRLVQPGRWSVGGVDGPALQVTSSGARSWVLRLSSGGRQREIGLGSFPTVTLASVRDEARRQRELSRLGNDPIAVRRAIQSAAAAKRATQRTFAEVAARYVAHHERSWKNAKHHAQWSATLRTYAEPVLGRMLVSDIRAAHVIRVLEPIGRSRPRRRRVSARGSRSSSTTRPRTAFTRGSTRRAGRAISTPPCRTGPRSRRYVTTPPSM